MGMLDCKAKASLNVISKRLFSQDGMAPGAKDGCFS